MWERRREIEPSLPENQKSTTAPPVIQRATETPREAPAAPAKNGAATNPPPALIGPELSIIGEVTTEQDLNIAGKIQGPVYCSDAVVSILPGGHVRGEVYAREVILSGTIEGDVVAKTRLMVRHDARLIGNVSCAAIMIEETAYFKGSIDIVRPSASETRNAEEAVAATA